MNQFVKEQADKIIVAKIKEARLQRQSQVRQQALAWTGTNREKFEELKDEEIKNLSEAIVAQIQETAMKDIEQLTFLNDLATAEIGMAHRAAAGFENVEKLRSLKKAKDIEVAKNRGTTAIARQLKKKQEEKGKQLMFVKRRLEVRRAEDRLAKEMISRKPLTVTNKIVDTRTNTGPPKRHQNIANTLKTADRKKATPAGENQRSPSKAKKPTSKAEMLPMSRSSSGSLQVEGRNNRGESLQYFVRIKAKSASVPPADIRKNFRNKNELNLENIFVGLVKRNNYLGAIRGDSVEVQPSTAATVVRYFDATIPKSEVKYVAPEGLAVKETRDSPNAWEKGKHTSEEAIRKQKVLAAKKDELEKKTDERGRLALRKAKLEKERSKVKNELLEGVDFDQLGVGSQKAILGLEIAEGSNDKTIPETDSSDEFIAADTDDDYSFPSPHVTVKKYSVGRKSSLKNLLTQAQILSNRNKKDRSSLLKVGDDQKLISETDSSDEFLAVNSDDDFSFPTHHLVGSKSEESKSASLKDLLIQAKKVERSKKARSSTDTTDHHKPDSQAKNKVSAITDHQGSTVHVSQKKNIPEEKHSLQKRRSPDDDTTKGGIGELQKKSEIVNSQDDLKASTVGRKNGSRCSNCSSHSEPKKSKVRDPTKKSSERKSLQLYHSSSAATSTSELVNLKIQQEIDIDTSSYQSQLTSSQINDTSTNQHSNSDGNGSSLLHLRVIENTPETSGSTDRSSNMTTDYYSPPDGPYTSTPDGKLLRKNGLHFKANDKNYLKKLALKLYVDKFLQHKPSSIEDLPISSTSSTSMLRADSDVLETESFEAIRNLELDNQSSTLTSTGLPTLQEDFQDVESASTIAETAIVARRLIQNATTSSTDSSLQNNRTDTTLASDSQNQSRSGSDQPSIESLSGLLKVLSNYQVVESEQIENDEDFIIVESTHSSSTSSGSRNHRSNGPLDSSGASIPDLSAVLRRLRRNSPRTISSASASSKSGPDVETKRILLEDITPAKLWETPPQTCHTDSNNEAEKLTAVFENLKEKFSKIRIEKPVW